MTTLFHERVRSLLDEKRLSIADLAGAAELAPSLLSKLLTDTADVRREPRIEHILALARALEVSPADLIGGTDASPLLGEWVPRAELEAETAARAGAQREAAELRTKLAGAAAETQALNATVERVGACLEASKQEHATAEVRFRLEFERLCGAVKTAEARLASALEERDHALTEANRYYREWANAYSHYQLLQRQIAEHQTSTGLKTLVAAIGGAFVGVAAAELSSSTPSNRPTRTRTRRN